MDHQITEQQMDKRIREALPFKRHVAAPNDFTSNVMEAIAKEPGISGGRYAPIISKKGWWVISFLITGLLFISWVTSPTDSNELLKYLHGFTGFLVPGKSFLSSMNSLFSTFFDSKIFLPVVGAFGLAILSFLFQWRLQANNRQHIIG